MQEKRVDDIEKTGKYDKTNITNLLMAIILEFWGSSYLFAFWYYFHYKKIQQTDKAVWTVFQPQNTCPKTKFLQIRWNQLISEHQYDEVQWKNGVSENQFWPIILRVHQVDKIQCNYDFAATEYIKRLDPASHIKSFGEDSNLHTPNLSMLQSGQGQDVRKSHVSFNEDATKEKSTSTTLNSKVCLVRYSVTSCPESNL